MDFLGSRKYFEDMMKFEKGVKGAVEKFLCIHLQPTALKDISGEADGIKFDRDYVVMINGKWVRVECKTRRVKYAQYFLLEILIETMSSREMNTQGWITKSTADMLAYMWELENSEVEGFIFDLPKLQEWWINNKNRYNRVVEAPNPPENPLYHTVNIVVPVNDLPSTLFVYSPFDS